MAIDEWHDMMPFTVGHQPFLSRNAEGAPTFGASKSYRAFITNEPVRVRGPDGSDVIARGICVLGRAVDDSEGSPVVGTEDRITLPDGSTPLIINSNRAADDTGWHHTTVYFG